MARNPERKQFSSDKDSVEAVVSLHRRPLFVHVRKQFAETQMPFSMTVLHGQGLQEEPVMVMEQELVRFGPYNPYTMLQKAKRAKHRRVVEILNLGKTTRALNGRGHPRCIALADLAKVTEAAADEAQQNPKALGIPDSLKIGGIAIETAWWLRAWANCLKTQTIVRSVSDLVFASSDIDWSQFCSQYTSKKIVEEDAGVTPAKEPHNALQRVTAPETSITGSAKLQFTLTFDIERSALSDYVRLVARQLKRGHISLDESGAVVVQLNIEQLCDSVPLCTGMLPGPASHDMTYDQIRRAEQLVDQIYSSILHLQEEEKQLATCFYI